MRRLQQLRSANVIKSKRVIQSEPCSRCGRAETIILESEDLNTAKTTGIAGKAVNHGDHILVVFFGSKGSHRGQYVYDTDIKLYHRLNSERVQLKNQAVRGIVVIYSNQEAFNDSCCSIFDAEETALMITNIMSSINDLRVPDRAVAPIHFAGIELFVIRSQEKVILIFPHEKKGDLVKQKAQSLLSNEITPESIDDIFSRFVIEDVTFAPDRFIRLASIYPKYVTIPNQENKLDQLAHQISYETGVQSPLVKKIISLVATYANGTRNLRILFSEWIITQATDNLDLFLAIMSSLEKNGYIQVKERRLYLRR